jgi:branched-chain amino acid aminotransferase
MAFVFYDDTFIQASNLNITSSNRLFKYGDGLFESIYISAKKPLFIEKHIQRLIAGMAALEILVPPTWNTAYFTTILTELIKKNNVLHARCRMTVCRSG